MQKTREILPTAFRPKIISINHLDKTVLNFQGCVCKTGCNRKYCECFKRTVDCSPFCKCTHCKNSGSPLDSKLLDVIPKPVRSKSRLVIGSISDPKNNNSPIEACPMKINQNLSDPHCIEETESFKKNSSKFSTTLKERVRTEISFENYKKVKLQTLKF